MSRIIDVTNGEAQYVTAQVTELLGQPLASTTWELALGGDDPTVWPPADAWRPADRVVPVSPTVARTSLLVDENTEKANDRRLWVRAADSPEVIVLVLNGSHNRIDVV